MIVDETKTGMGASGKNWAHEHWFLNDGPDFVTFGGKSGISGFFSSNDHRLDDSEVHAFAQNVNVAKLHKYGEIQNQIETDNVLHYLMDTASFLKIELTRAGKESGNV